MFAIFRFTLLHVCMLTRQWSQFQKTLESACITLYITFPKLVGRSTYSPSNYNPGLRRSMSVAGYPSTHRSCIGDASFRSLPDTPHQERRVSTCRPSIRRDRPMTTVPRHVNIYADKENENPNRRSRLPGLHVLLTINSHY